MRKVLAAVVICVLGLSSLKVMGEELREMIPLVPDTQNVELAQFLADAEAGGSLGTRTFMAHAAAHPVMMDSVLLIAEYILATFPPDTYDYLSIGRSGAGVALALEALLELRGERPGSSVEEFPLTGLRQGYFKVHWYEHRLRAHFDRYFPASARSTKKILALDYTRTGTSLRGFNRILTFAEEVGWVSTQVEILAMMDANATPMRVRLEWDAQIAGERGFPAERLHLLKLPPVLSKVFFYNGFKDYAQYGEWDFRDLNFEERMKNYEFDISMGRANRHPRAPAPLRARINESLFNPRQWNPRLRPPLSRAQYRAELQRRFKTAAVGPQHAADSATASCEAGLLR